MTAAVTYRSEFDPRDWSRYLDLDEVRRLGVAAAVDAHLAQHRARMFFEKNSDWEPEREFRCCVFNQPASSTTALPLPPGAVRGIVVGLDMPESALSDLKIIADMFHVTAAAARVYVHQLNVLDVHPLNREGTPWRFYSRRGLQDLGYL
jgi:hypothetical protein